MPEGLDKFASAVGDVLKIAPTIYEDALQPTIQEAGKFTARIIRAINAAFSSLDKRILNKEYAIEETKKLLEMKLENVNPEKIVPPKAYVAVPAIQAISYSMNSEELRNLYANFLAKAMNSDTKDSVHPSYVNIISQMTPLDAKILQIISNAPDKDIPIIDLTAFRISGNYKVFITLQPNITSLDISSIELISISIENLIRNNLIYITDNENSAGYNSIYNNECYKVFYTKEKENLPTECPNIEAIQKNCDFSNLGKHFCEICTT